VIWPHVHAAPTHEAVKIIRFVSGHEHGVADMHTRGPRRSERSPRLGRRRNLLGGNLSAKDMYEAKQQTCVVHVGAVSSSVGIIIAFFERIQTTGNDGQIGRCKLEEL